LLSQPLIKGFSLVGGEPIDNLDSGDLLRLVKRIKAELPHISIYCWTGYTYETIIDKPKVKDFLEYIDLLRDGEFIFELKDLNQYLQGSNNQRYINIKESLKQNKVIEFKWK
jgi:anaerobic ribonucleoside-triphosphate reductase activating protein